MLSNEQIETWQIGWLDACLASGGASARLAKFAGALPELPVCCSAAKQLAGWLAGSLTDWPAGWLPGLLGGLLVGDITGWLAGKLIGIGWRVGCLASDLDGWLAMQFAELADCLAFWLAD